jgi:hypothetical protein
VYSPACTVDDAWNIAHSKHTPHNHNRVTYSRCPPGSITSHPKRKTYPWAAKVKADAVRPCPHQCWAPMRQHHNYYQTGGRPDVLVRKQYNQMQLSFSCPSGRALMPKAAAAASPMCAALLRLSMIDGSLPSRGYAPTSTLPRS